MLDIRPTASRVIGIDASTKSLAYAVFEDEEPITCGEIVFEGADVYKRLADARIRTQELMDAGVLKGDYIAMESAVMVNNREVVIKLAYVFGVILGVLVQDNTQVITVSPLSWQSAIGNPNFKKAERDALVAENPGESASWYKNKIREIRKQRTADFASKYFDVDELSDNVTDAIGICVYAVNHLTTLDK